MRDYVFLSKIVFFKDIYIYVMSKLYLASAEISQRGKTQDAESYSPKKMNDLLTAFEKRYLPATSGSTQSKQTGPNIALAF